MKYVFTLIACALAFYGSAQKIENVNITQNGGELQFQYDINSSTDYFFKVSVYYSVDKQNWALVEKVYGDVGDSIVSGKSKKAIVWIDHLGKTPDNISFKIAAEYLTVDPAKEGNLNDKLGFTYNWIRVGQTRWMTQNLKSAKTDNDCGGYFVNSAARNACPDEWSLPTDEQWMELEIAFGGNKDKVKEHGLHGINLNELKNAGFILEECKYKTSFYPNQKALAFWSSTENKMLYTGYSDKYLARIFRLDQSKVSKELRLKTEELSIRCVQDASYIAKIEATADITINKKVVTGVTNDPFNGEELDWIYLANTIWLKKDQTGSYMHKELTNRCPAGWRLANENEWKDLFNAVKPSLKLENSKEILSERVSAQGIWSLNLANSDYWMDMNYYTYNTFWINRNDKEDSKKLMAFPSNKDGKAGWVEKQSNEKAKVRCVLENKDYMNDRASIKSGTFIDNRDKKEYATVEIDGTTWMAENLKYDMGENSKCRNDIMADCKLFGHMYNIEVSQNACPDGWRLPTQDEWKYLLINKAANRIKILYPFGGTGFNLLFGGVSFIDDDKKTEVFTVNYLFDNNGKPGYYYIDSKGKVELNEKAKKKDFYYIRCVKK